MCYELDFIKCVLFEENIITFNYERLNLEKIVKIGSKELMLPALYSRIMSIGIDKYFPHDFISFLKKINQFNLERNEILIEEIKCISKILNNSKIEFLFIKGSANQILKVYDNISDRMVNDIDILVSEKDLDKANQIFLKNKYKKITEFDFFESKHRHLTRLVNKNKIFAVEIHKEILGDKMILNTEDIFRNKIKVEEAYIPKINHMHQITIYNNQINDSGSKKLEVSLRAVYDIFRIEKMELYEDIKRDKFINKFYSLSNKIFNPKFVKSSFKLNFMDRFRFYFRKNVKAYYLFENNVFKLINRIKWAPYQIIEFSQNSKYRNYLKNKYL